MWITRIKLKNFIGIYNGILQKEIEIHFDKENHFILIAGENGSGKSTLLKALHPFSGIEPGKTLIRPDKKGSKEISYSHDGHVYEIKHLYEPNKKGTHTVKSFITKDGNELNPNGNTTSFNEIINIELGLNYEYLKLIRMGTGFSSFITDTATERKNYISKYLSGIDAYLLLYKNVNNKYKEMKTIIKSINEKLNKYGKISDIEVDLAFISKALNKLEYDRTKLISDKSIKLGKLSVIDPDGKLKDEFDTVKKEIKSISKDINKLSKKIKNSEYYSTEYSLSSIYDNILTFYNRDSYELESLKIRRSDKITRLSELKEELDTIDAEIDKLDKIDEYDDYMELYQSYKDKIKKMKNTMQVFMDDDRISKITQSFTIAEQINNMIEGLPDLSYKERDLYKSLKNENLVSIIVKNNTDVNILQNKINELHVMNGLLNNKNINLSNVIQLRPSNCNNPECPILKNLIHENDNSEIKIADNSELISAYTKQINEISKYNDSVIVIRDFIKISKTIMSFINDNDNLFKYNSFIKKSLDDIESLMLDKRRLYSKDSLLQFRSILNECSEYNELIAKLPMLNKEIELLKINKDIYDGKYLRKRNILENINDIKVEIEALDSAILKVEFGKNNYENDLDNLTKLIEIEAEIKELSKTYSSKMKKLSKEMKLYNEIKDYANEILEIDDSLNKINLDYKNYIDERDSIIFKMKQVKKLNKEKKALNSKFENVEMLKDTLSVNKGIPLLYMKLYLSGTRIIANKILKNTFGGTLLLDEFEIDEKEFKIPLINKGERNKDVSTASEGQKTMVGLSLSFALVEQICSSYRIMLLDEMDAALDVENKRMFIEIMEQQRKSRGIKQVFLTSHNNNLDTNSTALILLKNHNINNVKKQNILYEF